MSQRSQSLRLLPRISYYEPEEPNLDEYVFCEKCADYVYEYCSIHGALLVIPDDKVPTNHTFPSFVPRAALTTPHVFLHLNYSSIPGAGLGVFATLTLPCGVRFGPYKGERAKDIRTEYCWQIYDRNNKPSHVIDASNENKSNWMRYVNCARHWSEQNLVAYQYQGKLYYRTIKIIPRFTELMVFYGSEFANSLHINIGKYNSPSCYARKFGAPLPKKPKFDAEKKIQQLALKPIEETYREKKDWKELSNNSQIKENETDIKIASGNVEVPKENIEPNKDIKITTRNIDNPKKRSSQVTFAMSTPKKRKIEIRNKIPPLEENTLAPSKEDNIASKPTTTEVSKKRKAKEIIKKTKLRSKQGAKARDEECILKTYINNPTCMDANINFDNSKSVDGKLTTSPKNFEKKNLFSNSGRKTRIATLIEDTYFFCDACKYQSVDKDSLQKHLKFHDMQRLFVCETCGYRFSTISSLNVHKFKQHDIKTSDLKIHKCNVCDYVSTLLINVKRHLRTHTGEKPYICDMCGYKSSQAIHLKRHLRTHTGEKPYTCDKCDYTCSVQSSLKTHLRTHTGEKPYTCDKCDYTCSVQSSLKTHLRTHTGEKPYTCDKCDYTCSVKSSLKTHLRTHTGEKPYTCDTCGYKSSQATHLKRHLRTHTGEKPYTCDICDYKCVKKTCLYNHLKKIHLT